jgi:type I restriction enzyme S subunit
MARLARETVIGKFPLDWNVVDTQELLSDGKDAIKIGPFGSQLKKELLIKKGIKVYGQENVFDNDFSIGNRFITIEKFEQLKSCEIKADDILITMMGTIGSIGIVPPNIEIGIMDSHLLRLRIDKTKFDNKFVLYLLKSKFIQTQIQNLSVGCIMDGLSSSIIKRLIFIQPSLLEQKNIASVLSALDSKMELNNRINLNLEAMVKTLYDYWFVQFNFPNENGKPFKSSGGKMVWNQELKREIPEGWKVKRIGDVAKFVNGKGIKRKYLNSFGKFPVFGANGITGFTDEKQFENPVVAIGRVGANYGEVHYSLHPCWITDNAVAAQPNQLYYLWWLIETLKRINYKKIAGGSAQPLITQGQLKELKFAIPEDFVFIKFDSVVNPAYLAVNSNIKQSQVLIELRDWLLPMLMNGQISVN